MSGADANPGADPDPGAGLGEHRRDRFRHALGDVVERIARDMSHADLSPPRAPDDAFAAEPEHGGLGRAAAPFLAAARARVAAVPGCRATRCEPDVAANAAPGSFRLVCSGWSPSLHHHEWMAEIDEALAIDHPHVALAALDDPLDLMRARARDAAAIGLDAPLEHGDGGEDQPVEVGHLAIDRGWLAVALANAFHELAPRASSPHEPVRREPEPDPDLVAARATEIVESVVAHLAASIGRAHDPDADPTPPGITLGDERNRVRETPSADGARIERVVEGYETILLDRRPIAVVTGSDVILHQRLPDVTLAACAGRRLGEIAAVHPALDGRVVAAAERVGLPLTRDGTRLSLVPDLVRVGDAAGMVETAMRRLEGRGE